MAERTLQLIRDHNVDWVQNVSDLLKSNKNEKCIVLLAVIGRHSVSLYGSVVVIHVAQRRIVHAETVK